MKTETTIREQIEDSQSSQGEDRHNTESLKEQLKLVQNKKSLLIKHITQMENEVKTKEKLLSKT